jgi:hypothetical protein
MKGLTMRDHLIRLILSVALLTVGPLLFAEIGWDVSLSGGGYASFPSSIQQDELAMRTHGSVSTIISPIFITLPKNMAISFQMAVHYTTKSIAYQAVYWEQFTAVSGGIEMAFLRQSPLHFSLALLYTHQFSDDDRTSIHFISTRAAMIIPLAKQKGNYRFSLITPIEIDFRSDYIGSRYSIGLRFTYMRDDL